MQRSTDVTCPLEGEGELASELGVPAPVGALDVGGGRCCGGVAAAPQAAPCIPNARSKRDSERATDDGDDPGMVEPQAPWRGAYQPSQTRRVSHASSIRSDA